MALRSSPKRGSSRASGGGDSFGAPAHCPIIFAAVAFIAPCPDAAADRSGAFYVEAGGGLSSIPDLDANRGDVETAFGAVGGLAVGLYATDWLRLEVEGGYRFNKFDRLLSDSASLLTTLGSSRPAGGARAALDVSGDAAASAGFVNAYMDIDAGGGWRPYLGLGVGYARYDWTLRSGAATIFHLEDEVAIGQARAGLAVPLDRAVALTAGYRLTASEDLRVRAVDGSLMTFNPLAHSFELGFRLLFGGGPSRSALMAEGSEGIRRPDRHMDVTVHGRAPDRVFDPLNRPGDRRGPASPNRLANRLERNRALLDWGPDWGTLQNPAAKKPALAQRLPPAPPPGAQTESAAAPLTGPLTRQTDRLLARLERAENAIGSGSGQARDRVRRRNIENMLVTVGGFQRLSDVRAAWKRLREAFDGRLDDARPTISRSSRGGAARVIYDIAFETDGSRADAVCAGLAGGALSCAKSLAQKSRF